MRKPYLAIHRLATAGQRHLAYRIAAGSVRKGLCLIMGILTSCAPKQAVPAHSSSELADPGWSYSAVNGTLVNEDGGRYDLVDPAHGSLRVNASVFAIDLSVEVDVLGFTAPVTENAIVSLEVFDGWDRPLAIRPRPRSTNSCRFGGRPRSGFSAGINVCTITGDFKILDFGESKKRITVVVKWTDGLAYESRFNMTMAAVAKGR